VSGAVDRAAAGVAAAVEVADVILLAAPPAACLGLLDDLAGPYRGTLGAALVTDVASTKGAIVEHARSLGLRFVGGHPMAGLETSGYGAARSDLFVDRPWVVVPGTAAPADVEAVESIARACRARPVRMAADVHDEAVAAISHLPLVVAAALVEAVAGSPDVPRADWPAARTLVASGWRDTTRLARGDVAMGAGIAATNAAAIARRLRDLQAVLDAWLADLEHDGGPNGERIERRLRAARSALEQGG
jgi:prephenate dehydrogenase